MDEKKPWICGVCRFVGFGFVNHKMTGTSWWISMDGFCIFLLFKEDIFSQRVETQSLICFGPLEEVDELDGLWWANRKKYSVCSSDLNY